MAKRNTYTPEYKAKIVIEILEGEQTISEIASREGINVNQLKNWKKEFLRTHPVPLMVQNQKRKQKEQLRTQKSGKKSLCRNSSHLTVQVDWLKKKSEEVLGPDWKEKSGYEE